MSHTSSATAATGEAEVLRRTVRDLVAIAALPALWVGLAPEAVLSSLAEALHQILRGDWVYAVLDEAGDVPHGACVRTAWGNTGRLDAATLAGMLGPALEVDGPHEFADPLDQGALRVFVARLPLEGASARLAFASRRPDFPRADELLLINVAVNQGAVALQAARLLAARDRAEYALRESHARLQEESRTVETLREVGLALAAELDLDALLQRVTNAATELSGAEFGAFFYNVRDDRGEAYRLFTISGAPRERFSAFPMPRNTAVFAPTFHGEGVVRSDDITRDPRYGRSAPHHGMPPGHLPVRSYLAVPVVSRSGEVLGGLFFGHSSAGVFGAREERLVSGIAAHAAVAFDNARLYEAERQARAEAEAAVRARDEFLGIASHELRNPLAGLTASLQLLRRWHARGQLDAPRLARFLGAIDASAARLSALLDDLLDVSRLRAGQLRLHPQPTDLAAVVRDLVERHRQQHPDREIELTVAGADYRLLLDPDRIEQVVANLLSNALKYSPNGGEAVRVSVHEGEDEGILLHVRDAGIGLPAGATEAIFEPFGRAANAAAMNIPGMGLGLYICRHIVQSHGGRIWAESQGEGHGTTLSVWLPRAKNVADG